LEFFKREKTEQRMKREEKGGLAAVRERRR
jgi:hypothetical protein